MSYLVVDIETVPDLSVYRKPEIKEGEKEPFPPAPAHQVVCIGLLFLDEMLLPRKLGVVYQGGERQILTTWNDFMRTKKPVLITWNGRGFDLPVLMARSLGRGVDFSWYFDNNYRYRYSEDWNVDLCDQMGDYGAARGLKLDHYARLCGLPGKGDVDGGNVEQMMKEGREEDVAAYCLTDVLQTGWLFARWRFLRGKLSREMYEEAIKKMAEVAIEVGEKRPALGKFMEKV